MLSFLKHFHTLTERTFHRGDFARANFHDDGGNCAVRRVLVEAGSIRFLSHSSFYFGKYSNSRLTPTNDDGEEREEKKLNFSKESTGERDEIFKLNELLAVGVAVGCWASSRAHWE